MRDLTGGTFKMCKNILQYYLAPIKNRFFYSIYIFNYSVVVEILNQEKIFKGIYELFTLIYNQY